MGPISFISPLVLVAAYAVISVFHAVLSPLWRVPGPLVSRFTSLSLKWHELRGNRTRHIHDLHLRYGPVVLVAPSEVSFTSGDAIAEIYNRGGGFDKTDFYDLFTIFSRRTMFTMLNKDQHARRKRDIADRYANSNVMKPDVLDGIYARSTKFMAHCAAYSGGSLDIFIYLHAYACDCVTHHLFHPLGSNALEDESDREMMHQVASDDSLQNRLIYHYSPVLHKLVAPLLPFLAKPRETPLADNFVLRTSRYRDPASFTLLDKIQGKAELPHSGWDHLNQASECLDHMAAGIDTTGDALCFIMWQLSQPESLETQARLRRECLQNADVSFERLPWLDAVVMEGLRCFPVIPMSLPRQVPAQGRIVDQYFLPAGTVASSQAWSVHRLNNDVFPDPDEFKPERWLEADGDADRRKLMWAFSSGGRGCIGKHLALAEMKILLRDVYSQFHTLPDPSMQRRDMEMSDQLISSRPAGQRCLLRFLPLSDSN